MNNCIPRIVLDFLGNVMIMFFLFTLKITLGKKCFVGGFFFQCHVVLFVVVDDEAKA